MLILLKLLSYFPPKLKKSGQSLFSLKSLRAIELNSVVDLMYVIYYRFSKKILILVNILKNNLNVVFLQQGGADTSRKDFWRGITNASPINSIVPILTEKNVISEKSTLILFATHLLGFRTTSLHWLSRLQT